MQWHCIFLFLVFEYEPRETSIIFTRWFWPPFAKTISSVIRYNCNFLRHLVTYPNEVQHTAAHTHTHTHSLQPTSARIEAKRKWAYRRVLRSLWRRAPCRATADLGPRHPCNVPTGHLITFHWSFAVPPTRISHPLLDVEVKSVAKVISCHLQHRAEDPVHGTNHVIEQKWSKCCNKSAPTTNYCYTIHIV